MDISIKKEREILTRYFNSKRCSNKHNHNCIGVSCSNCIFRMVSQGLDNASCAKRSEDLNKYIELLLEWDKENPVKTNGDILREKLSQMTNKKLIEYAGACIINEDGKSCSECHIESCMNCEEQAINWLNQPKEGIE